MKRLSQILSEASETFYHASTSDKIDTKSKHPIWLSHNEHQARGWHNIVPESKSFEVTLKRGTKIAHHADHKVQEHLSKHGVNVRDYEADMTVNPESHEVHNHPGTKALKAAGYHGFTHIDYDPHDNQRDHDSTLLFDRSRIKSHKQIF